MHLKIDFAGDIRRVSWDEDVSYGGLRNVIGGLYTTSEGLHVYYCDDDGDMVKIGSDAELHEALSIMGTGSAGLFRLWLGQDGGRVPAPGGSSSTAPTAKPREMRGEGSSGPQARPSCHGAFGAGRCGGRGMGYRGMGCRGKFDSCGGGYMGRFAGPWQFFPMSGCGFMMGPLMNLMREFEADMSEDVRNAWQKFMSGMIQSGEFTLVPAMIPSLVRIIREFGETYGAGDEAPSPQTIELVTESLRASLEDVIAEENLKNLSKLVELTFALPSFRRFFRAAVDIIGPFVDTGTSETDPALDIDRVLQKKEWEKEPDFDGLSVPPAPLARGDRGAKVAQLHQVLLTLDIMNKSDIQREGIYRFEEITEQALTGYQDKHELLNPSDAQETRGIYDATTRASLLSLMEQK